MAIRSSGQTPVFLTPFMVASHSDWLSGSCTAQGMVALFSAVRPNTSTTAADTHTSLTLPLAGTSRVRLGVN